MTYYVVAALKQPCQTCDAYPGEPCTDLPDGGVHLKRVVAAIRYDMHNEPG